jgi:hypothetical protein
VALRAGIGVILGTWLSLWAASASAATFVYRDGTTACPMFVEQADRIPRNARDGARLVSEAEALRDKPSAEACARAAAQRLTSPAPAPGREVVDLSLARNHGRLLSESELAALRSLARPEVAAYALAGLAALAAWIAVMVAAFRRDHLGWAMLMLFLSAPMAFIYLFVGFDKGPSRFRAACLLAMLSPLLVFLAEVWHLWPPAMR